jgi:hypothetical protein
MAAVFLKAEIASKRFGQEIMTLLRCDGMSRRVLDAPDISNTAENAYRRQFLGVFRGYRQKRALFEDFPEEVAWYRAALSGEEVTRVKYVNYSYWNEISGGSRLPIEAVKAIQAGCEIYGQRNDNFLEAAQALRKGVRFPELILIGASLNAELIVLEGHVRLTAYLLAPECLPNPLEVIIGFAPAFARWE